MVKAKLESFGLTTQDVCHASNACSIVAEKAGATHPEEVILVIAHIDSVGQKFAGADDNGSGTAALVEMARVLSKVENKRTYRFFVTNGEELGLLGANYYAAQLKKQGKIKDIVLAINMDMVGYNSNGMVELETDSQYESVAKWYAEVAATYTSLKTKITIGAWGSDHVPFIHAGAPTLLTIEYWDTKTPCYHQACDTPDTVNYPYATEITKLNVAAVLAKDLQ
jgi:Zn-dependent M28 family amino/carboxypeptidase